MFTRKNSYTSLNNTPLRVSGHVSENQTASKRAYLNCGCLHHLKVSIIDAELPSFSQAYAKVVSDQATARRDAFKALKHDGVYLISRRRLNL